MKFRVFLITIIGLLLVSFSVLAYMARTEDTCMDFCLEQPAPHISEEAAPTQMIWENLPSPINISVELPF
jgi:hypothetical protein